MNKNLSIELNITLNDTALYGRQSLDKKDSVSIEAQLEKGRAVCVANNWNIYKEYYDKGYSGKDINRPEFQKLLKDIEHGYIKKVIVYRLDRISRSITDFANLLNFFEKYDVTFISATENFDTSSPLGRAMIYIIMVFAQLERETIAERITDNYYFRAKQGLFMGGGIPYGFTSKRIIGQDGKKKSVLEINNDEMTIVKNIYNWYLDNKSSIRSVVVKLNNLKIKPRNNRLWSANQISRILTRPLYTSNSPEIYNYYANTNINIIDSLENFDGNKSLTIIGKETGKGQYRKYIDISEQFLVTVDMPPVIDSTTWLNVQNKMKHNKQIAPRTGQSKTCFLSGLLFCGHCGYSMSSKIQNKKGKQYSYICCNTKKNRGYTVCNSKLHSIKELENAVITHLIKHLQKNNVYTRLSKIKETKEIDVALINKKHLLEANISKSNNEIQNLLKIVSEGHSVANSYIQKTIEDIDNKISDFKIELAKIDSEIYNAYSKYDQLTDIREYLKAPEKIINYDFDIKKQICKAFIKKIIVNNDNLNIDYIL